jgi:hypothetical protein
LAKSVLPWLSLRMWICVPSKSPERSCLSLSEPRARLEGSLCPLIEKANLFAYRNQSTAITISTRHCGCHLGRQKTLGSCEVELTWDLWSKKRFCWGQFPTCPRCEVFAMSSVEGQQRDCTQWLHTLGCWERTLF